MSNIIVVGGGAAGMMASITAAKNGHKVTIFERNEKLGKKVYITGKGRCNFTNAGDNEDLLNSVVTNRKFMYSAFNKFSNYDCMGFFDELGLKFKIERGNRVFPESDKASDVIDSLRRELQKNNVKIEYNSFVKDLIIEDGRCTGVILKDNKKIKGDSVIMATGGCSYPTTGSTKESLEMVKNNNVKVVKCIPALVPMIAKEEWVKELQGLSLRNIAVNYYINDKEIYNDFGEMMFTHFGVTGPVVLSASSYIAKKLQNENVKMKIDLKPALNAEQLDERICRDFEEFKNKQFRNSLEKLLPKKMISVIVDLSNILPEKKVNEITHQERSNLVNLIKNLELTITGTRGFNEAIVTQGGVDVKEVNPSTMECKHIKNLYFVGEMLDVDAVTGGFNLQIAWSTAFTAANNIE